LSSAELEDRLKDGLAFIDDERFDSQYATALRALGELPAYRLRYGNDPVEAARLFPGLLASLHAKVRAGLR
jgi:hypothetical protein